MAEKTGTYTVFISAAEPSADGHCADLITEMQKTGRSVNFVGLGGRKMKEAGCQLLENTAQKAAMTYQAFGQVARFFMILRKVKSFFAQNKVDLVIVCDSPAFNFHVAKAAKKANIKTMFYVAPQLWAWAPWRIKKLKRCCDKLCCILPFEENWFKERGVDAVFVGNPMLDESQSKIKHAAKTYEKFDKNNVKIAIMPGSRQSELQSLWPSMQKLAFRLKSRYKRAEFITVAADAEKKEQLKSCHIIGFQSDYSICTVNETAAWADLSIIASGSATLQVAAAGCPMVVMYQSNKILWHLVGKWLVRLKYLSLVNILAQKELVPEFMPYFDSIDPIFDTIVGLIEDRDKLVKTSRELIELTGNLNTGQVSKKVAQIANEMI